MDKSIYLIDDALWKIFVYDSSKNLNKSFDDIIGDYFSDLLNDYGDVIPNQYKVLMRNVYSLN